MSEALKDLVTFILPAGAAGSVITWLVNRPKQRNDFVAELQKSIDLLSEKLNQKLTENLELKEVLISLKTELAAIRDENKTLLAGQEELKRENAGLREEVNSLREQLAGIKTITKTK